MKITRTMTPRGLRSDLFFRYRGVRYRPVLGYNLTRGTVVKSLNDAETATTAEVSKPVSSLASVPKNEATE